MFMDENVTLTAEQSMDVIDGELEFRRGLRSVVTRNPSGRLAKRASALLLDRDRFDDWVLEFGGEEIAVGYVCAQVISGVSLKTLCEHYVLDAGLLGALMTKRPEYEERLKAAQRWLAETHVSEIVGIADDVDEEKQAIAKAGLRIKAREAVAAFYKPERFGKVDGSLSVGLENLADVLTRISERKRAPAVVDAEDAQVVE